MIPPFVELAKGYLKLGYSVIPIIPGEKKPGYDLPHWKSPIPLSNWTQYGERYPSIWEIEGWHRDPQAPSPGIGLLTGALSNVVALDFDHDVNGLHEKIKSLLPESPVKKRGAKGETWFFVYYEEKTQQWKDPASKSVVVEILSNRRQTILPPSIHPAGMNYEWLTRHTLLDLKPIYLPCLPNDFFFEMEILFPRPLIEGTKDIQKNPRKYYPLREDQTLLKVDSALSFLSPDDYQTWIETGMSLKASFGEAGFPLWESWSQLSPKYQDKNNNLERKWKSFKGSGRTIGSVFFEASKNGFSFKRNY